jgi:DNA segregation ATPase FtsK/SpoIIIE, S-DNA-T family
LDKYSWNIVGGIVAIFALLGLFQAGIVGKFMINVTRIFVGGLYPLGLLVVVIFGLVLAGFSRLPKIPLRYTLGTLLVLIGVLVWLTLIEYVQAAQPVDFMSFNWQKLMDDVASANTDSNIGGGILATALFYVSSLVIWKDWHWNCCQFSHPVWGLCSFQHFIFKNLCWCSTSINVFESSGCQGK